MALVGLLESLMTAKLVDDITDTHSDKTRESIGQGIANIVTGLFGGMGGCAMIGQTMINVKTSGARTRISTFLAGVFLLVLSSSSAPSSSEIPMAALVAVMIMVVGRHLRLAQHPPAHPAAHAAGETAVMVVTVAVVVATHNLAIGVVVGVRHRDGHLRPPGRPPRRPSTAVADPDGDTGASTRSPGSCSSPPATTSSTSSTTPTTRDGSSSTCPSAHIWDASTVAALDAITTKYAPAGQDGRDHRPQRAERALAPAQRQPRSGTLNGPMAPSDDAGAAPVSVWPILHYHDTESALAFLTEVLGFRGVLVARDSGAISHCELRWPEGGTGLFGSAAHTDGVHGGMQPGSAAMYVPTADVHGVHARAAAAGAELVNTPAETTFGSGDVSVAFTLRDPGGYLWTFGTYRGRPG